jgi:hypothetical protein
MAFADDSVYFNVGDGSILGCFREKDYGQLFEFSSNADDNDLAKDYPHKIWVCVPWSGIDQGFRYGNVKKTVVYIVTGEDENGPIVEKWKIKNHRFYPCAKRS